MRVVQLAIIGALIFGISLFAYDSTPKEVRYEIQDWFTRLTAKNFDWPPDEFSAREQNDLIGELNRRGYKLNCYPGGLPEDKVGNSDYVCWFVIKSAYDNIPARMVMLFFENKKLSNVKIEFPESSFPLVQSYLLRRLEYDTRLDTARGLKKFKDIYGQKTMVWLTKNGTVTTSSEPTSRQPITVLWTSKESLPSL